MICRAINERGKLNSLTGSSLRFPGWILVPQAEHARLAAEFLRGTPFDFRCRSKQEIRRTDSTIDWTVRHHDDGWKLWDAFPKTDSQLGRPVSFTEMTDDDSYQIWNRSIRKARQHSPEAGLAVLEHFLRLRTMFGDPVENKHDPFLADFQPLAKRWRSELVEAGLRKEHRLNGR